MEKKTPIIDNFDDFYKYISEFELNRGEYFEVQILRRGKDHPDLPAANRYYMSFNIHKADDLIRYKNDIIAVCVALKARAYIRTCPLDQHKVMLGTLEKIARSIKNNDIDTNGHRCFLSAQGITSPVCKRWVIDIDQTDPEIVESVSRFVNESMPVGDKIKAKIKTLNGYHLVTRPFAVNEFKERIKSFDGEPPEVKKHGLSVLYIPQFDM